MKLESLFAPLGHPLRAGLARTLCLALPFVAATLWAQTPDVFAAPRATFAKYYRQIVGTDAPDGLVAFAIDPKVSKTGKDAYKIVSGSGFLVSEPHLLT